MSAISSVFSFLETLGANNTRDRMHANQDAYKQAKTTVHQLAKTMITAVNRFDHTLADLTPEETLFRLARDTRFGKDKSPYKTNFGIVIAPGGKKSIFPCYYIHIQPGNFSFLGGGLYHPLPEVQQAIRQALVSDYKALQRIITKKTFSATRGGLVGDSYVRTPLGYDPHHPALDLIKHKDRLVHFPLSDKMLLADTYIETITNAFRVLHPFNAWLHNAIIESQ